METFLDLLQPLLGWSPTELLGRRKVKRYEAGNRVFAKGYVSGLSGLPRWATYLVAEHGWLSVAHDKGDDAILCPLPAPSLGSIVEECPGSVLHYRYESVTGPVEVYPEAPAACALVRRALHDMHLTEPSRG